MFPSIINLHHEFHFLQRGTKTVFTIYEYSELYVCLYREKGSLIGFPLVLGKLNLDSTLFCVNDQTNVKI